jgi:hypothetical protein
MMEKRMRGVTWHEVDDVKRGRLGGEEEAERVIL